MFGTFRQFTVNSVKKISTVYPGCKHQTHALRNKKKLKRFPLCCFALAYHPVEERITGEVMKYITKNSLIEVLSIAPHIMKKWIAYVFHTDDGSNFLFSLCWQEKWTNGKKNEE